MMSKNATILIAGGGQAADEAAFQLRQNGAQGRIVVIAEEPCRPYRRPPLSKTFLAGTADRESVFLRTPDTYSRADIDILTHRRATRIDRAEKCLTLDDGTRHPYDALILAIGGTPRRLTVPGADLAGMHYLRTIADAQALQDQMRPGQHMLVIGGGYVGLEVAAAAIKQGMRVTLLEAAPRLLARVASPEISAFYEQAHRDAGVVIHTGMAASSLARAENGMEVCCGQARFRADVIVAGIGLVPHTELAEQAGLVIDNGILVDAACRTSDPDIFAIGDCSAHTNHAFLGTPIRLESVANAIEQAKITAAILCGKPPPPAAPPWFWSEQYDLHLQMVGISAGYDRCVLRGSPANRAFSAFYLRDSRVIAADSINRPQDFMAAKRMVASRLTLAPDRIADESIPLKTLLA